MTSWTPTIARIAAIPIQAHWSWLATSAAVLVLLHGVYVNYTDTLSAWLLAAGAILGLLVSVVLHELGHALVAQRHGLQVRAITLFALGGATEASSEADDPVADLLVALAGPLVSLLLALLFLPVWWLSQATLFGLLALHLALTNAAVAAFNMLPGHPLDGSRVLRAVFWFLLDNELQAAQLVGQIGRNCGWLLAGGALAYLWSTGDLFNAGWVGLVSFALIRTSGSGYRQLVLRRTLGGVRVADVMQRVYRAVAPDLRLDQFVGQYLLGQTEQGFPVLRQSDQDTPQLLGMITVRNLRHYELEEWRFRHVSEVMTPADRVRFLGPDTPANEAFRVLLESGEDQLPVIDGQHLLGVLRRRDLVRHIQARLARLIGG